MKEETKAIIEIVTFTSLLVFTCLITIFGFLGVVKFLWGGNL